MQGAEEQTKFGGGINQGPLEKCMKHSIQHNDTMGKDSALMNDLIP